MEQDSEWGFVGEPSTYQNPPLDVGFSIFSHQKKNREAKRQHKTITGAVGKGYQTVRDIAWDI